MEVTKKTKSIWTDLVIFFLGSLWILVLCSKYVSGYMGAILSMWVCVPQLANFAVSLSLKRTKNLWILLRICPMLVYIYWVSYGLNDIFGGKADAQSGISIFFIAIYYFPLFIATWSAIILISWFWRQLVVTKRLGK